MSSLIPIDVIEDNVEVQITITNVLYKRIQALIFNGLPFKDMNHFLTTCKQITAGDMKTDPLAESLYTLLFISNLFEEGAKSQGKVVKKSYNTETKEVTVV